MCKVGLHDARCDVYLAFPEIDILVLLHMFASQVYKVKIDLIATTIQLEISCVFVLDGMYLS